MIKLALYAYSFYWLLGKAGFGISKKPMQGFGQIHDPFEHPMGEQVCNSCTHHNKNG